MIEHHCTGIARALIRSPSPLAVERRYDFPEFEDYLGDAG